MFLLVLRRFVLKWFVWCATSSLCVTHLLKILSNLFFWQLSWFQYLWLRGHSPNITNFWVCLSGIPRPCFPFLRHVHVIVYLVCRYPVDIYQFTKKITWSGVTITLRVILGHRYHRQVPVTIIVCYGRDSLKYIRRAYLIIKCWLNMTVIIFTCIFHMLIYMARIFDTRMLINMTVIIFTCIFITC